MSLAAVQTIKVAVQDKDSFLSGCYDVLELEGSRKVFGASH